MASLAVAGPGFINITFRDSFLDSQIAELSEDPRLGVQLPTAVETVVIDYSAPNVAKETRHFNELYAKLGILLTDDDLAGESTYQPLMPEVLARLDDAGLLVESDGAKVVFVPGFTRREGAPVPLIVQASTGGFNYATSDPWRRFFVKVTDGRRNAHLHVMTPDTRRWREQITFRDALRADPELAADYATLKRDLAAEHTDDRDAFAAAKVGFIRAVLDRST